MSVKCPFTAKGLIQQVICSVLKQHLNVLQPKTREHELLIVWLARLCHLNAWGTEGKGRSSSSNNYTSCVLISNTTYICSAPTTQEYCSLWIATVLLHSWGGLYVRWMRYRNTITIAFAAANCSKVSTDWDWEADGSGRSICDSYAAECHWIRKSLSHMLCYGVEHSESDWGCWRQDTHFFCSCVLIKLERSEWSLEPTTSILASGSSISSQKDI